MAASRNGGGTGADIAGPAWPPSQSHQRQSPFPALLPLPMCSSWYTPKPIPHNTGVSGLAVLSLTTLIWPHCREEGLGTAHIQAIQTSLPESAGTYYHVSRCTSGQESPQKASTGMTCPRCSSRGDDHVPGSQREVPRSTEVVEESSKGESRQSVRGCREKDKQVCPAHRAPCFFNCL